MQHRLNAWGWTIITGITLSLIAGKPTNAVSPAPLRSVAPVTTDRPSTLAQATPVSVEEYFLAAPASYFKMLDRDHVSPAVRSKLLKQSNSVIDLANGYVFTSSIAPDLCSYEMAIFRRSQGAHWVALNVGCTTKDTLAIFDPDRNWADVTAEVFPMAVLSQPGQIGPTIKLPRYGRTIEVKDENNQVVAKVTFDGEKFVTAR